MYTQNDPGGSAVPRRPLSPILIPLGVLACMILLIGWSAWPLLRPSRSIEVTQALYLPSGNENPDQAAATGAQDDAIATRTVQAAGWLEAEPFYIAATALADGVIEEILVLDGDHVEQGQPLARMVDDDARLRLAQAVADFQRADASLRIAESAFEAARQNWEAPYELERAVSSGQALLEERRAELAQLPSLIREEEALLLKAQEELKSIEQAYRNQAASEIEFVAARELVNAQAARLESARAKEDILNASIDRLRADLDAARRALELRIDDSERLSRTEAQVQLAKAERARRAAIRDEAQLELDRMTIPSPITGYVQRRLKAPGDKVMRGMDAPHSTHIVHLYDPAKLQVRVDVPLADASQVFVGQRCEVVVEVLPDRTFEGEVLIVTHQADLQKNTLEIKVRVKDPDPILRPEMLTRVKFLPEIPGAARSTPSGSRQLASVRVPTQVLDTRSTPPHVWVVSQRANGQGVLQAVSVDVLSEDAGWATVEGDLQPGTLIASNPADCKAGERIRVASLNGGGS